jgi:hypothetical protein
MRPGPCTPRSNLKNLASSLPWGPLVPATKLTTDLTDRFRRYSIVRNAIKRPDRRNPEIGERPSSLWSNLWGIHTSP